jgi:hypothetical protein
MARNIYRVLCIGPLKRIYTYAYVVLSVRRSRIKSFRASLTTQILVVF